LLMIAKQASWGGDEYQIDKLQVLHEQDALDGKQDGKQAGRNARIPRSGRQGQHAQELQRPGAYSMSPGEGFLRNRSFQKDTFIEQRAKKPPQGTDSTQVARHKQVQQQLQEMAALKTLSSMTKKPPQDAQGDAQGLANEQDLDRKPAAKPTANMSGDGGDTMEKSTQSTVKWLYQTSKKLWWQNDHEANRIPPFHGRRRG
jgi:hypothetical protein